MDETEYRESRLCQLLGNPVVYQIVVLLDNGGPTTPSALAKRAGRSVQRFPTAIKRSDARTSSSSISAESTSA